ncbi:MAG TPA: heavy-metal-associated domain-containing protein [Solirubrobacteraceae bacterium]|nr:heavy-metal-associated domain-containing protein [Solirubrobacteraceae bacterium]
MVELAYTVAGMSCGHCTQVVGAELRQVAGVASVDVELDTKRVVVRGERLDDAAMRAAIVAAGYEAA